MADKSIFNRYSKRWFPVLFALAFVIDSFAQNPIVTENALPGNPISEWGVPNFRDNRIAGFSNQMSLNSGETVRFKINVQSGATYTLKIYRIGYYGGNGTVKTESRYVTRNSTTSMHNRSVTGMRIAVTGVNQHPGIFLLQQFQVFTLQNWKEQVAEVIILYLSFAMMPAILIYICNFRMLPGRLIMDMVVIQYMMVLPAFPMVML